MYEGKVYRPPSEAHSLILQTTIGCPHNQCNFCQMYEDEDFRIKSIEEIKKNIAYAYNKFERNFNSVFLADGNSILMKTENMIKVLNLIMDYFPGVERITTYGSARYVVLKTPEELKRLREAGLSRIHTGMESGDQKVLDFINKGTTPEEIIRAGKMVKEADIELSEYYLVGIGGKSYSRQHATNSAKVLNQINPDFIRLRTFIPIKDTVLYQQYKAGNFKLLNPHQTLRETKILISNLKGINSRLLSDHISNYWDVNGKLPGDKTNMLTELDKALNFDISQFRDPARGRL